METPAALNPSQAQNFLFAGNATFTVVSKRTGARFTYRLQAPKLDLAGEPGKDSPVRFLNVLTGPDNTNDYRFAGTVLHGCKFMPSRKASIQETARSVVAFKWVLDHVLNGEHLGTAVEIHHAGTCGRCGRQLTTPESVQSGLGPVCAEKMGLC